LGYDATCGHPWRYLNAGPVGVVCHACNYQISWRDAGYGIWRRLVGENDALRARVVSLEQIIKEMVPAIQCARCDCLDTNERSRARMRVSAEHVERICLACLPDFVNEQTMGPSRILRRNDPETLDDVLSWLLAAGRTARPDVQPPYRAWDVLWLRLGEALPRLWEELERRARNSDRERWPC
jgi:hypothetical protein